MSKSCTYSYLFNLVLAVEGSMLEAGSFKSSIPIGLRAVFVTNSSGRRVLIILHNKTYLVNEIFTMKSQTK